MANISTTAFQDSLSLGDGGLYPFYRQQYSRQVGGTPLVRDLGDGLWRVEYTTTVVPITTAVDIEAHLMRLNGSLDWVYLYDIRRFRPKLWNGTDSLNGYTYTKIAGTLFEVTLTVPATALSQGDYFSFDFNGVRYLHRITEMVSATRARIWPALSMNAPNNSQIVVDKPSTKFKIDPGSVNQAMVRIEGETKLATVSFSGIQALVA